MWGILSFALQTGSLMAGAVHFELVHQLVPLLGSIDFNNFDHRENVGLQFTSLGRGYSSQALAAWFAKAACGIIVCNLQRSEP